MRDPTDRPERERRRHARVKVGLPGVMDLDNTERGSAIEVIDLSEGGSLVRTDQELAEGTVVRLSFEHGSAGGRVVRVDDDAPGVGLEFVDADQNLRSFVRELLAMCAQVHLRHLDDDDSED